MFGELWPWWARRRSFVKSLRARSHLDTNTLSFASVSQRLRGLWGAQNRSIRLLAGVVGVALVAGLAIFAAMRMRGPDYGVLFANLAPDDASAVVTKLKDAKIPYQLSNGGTTISVPQESVYEERVLLAGDGVVKGGGSGYELFDKMNFGMTDFQEKIAKQRATEGELQRTIAGLTPVESARVHIASPEASLYSTVQEPTTASVAIKTKPGMSLGPTEVRGITQLVANSVEGLKPENVTIVNQDGNVLVPSANDSSDPGLSAQAGAFKLTQEQLLAKQRYETNLQAKHSRFARLGHRTASFGGARRYRHELRRKRKRIENLRPARHDSFAAKREGSLHRRAAQKRCGAPAAFPHHQQ